MLRRNSVDIRQQGCRAIQEAEEEQEQKEQKEDKQTGLEQRPEETENSKIEQAGNNPDMTETLTEWTRTRTRVVRPPKRHGFE